jgi:LysM repeat protein
MKKPALLLLIVSLTAAIFSQQIIAFAASSVQEDQPTPTYSSWIVTSTPNPDGSIVHIVQEGETLWDIALAYGVPGSEIMTNSGNSAQTTDVYVGQVLIIRQPNPATQTPSLTPMPTRITAQATLLRPTLTPVPTQTLFPTLTPTDQPNAFTRVFADTQTVGLTLVGVSGVGIVLVLIFGFFKKSE